MITGRKKWIMYPKECVPPGVCPSEDGAEVVTPLSLMEWFSTFYMETQQPGAPQPLEVIVEPGEVIFVPNGWWHCVLNLEPSIAITQNFVSPRNLLNVLRFANDNPDLVSGYRGDTPLGQRLADEVNRTHPGLIDQLRSQDQSARKRPASVWAACTAGVDTAPFAFCFE